MRARLKVSKSLEKTVVEALLSVGFNDNCQDFVPAFGLLGSGLLPSPGEKGWFRR